MGLYHPKTKYLPLRYESSIIYQYTKHWIYHQDWLAPNDQQFYAKYKLSTVNNHWHEYKSSSSTLILINFHKTLVITQQKHELDFFEMMKSPWTTSDFGFFFTVLIILNPAVGQDFLPGAEPCEKSRLPRVGSQGSAAAAGAAARGSPGMLWPSDVWNRYIYMIYLIYPWKLMVYMVISSDSLGSAT